MKDLKGRTVLVTGASSGIGAAVASAFAHRGCRIALAARRVEKLDALSTSLQAGGTETFVVGCDVRDKGQAKAAVDAVVRHWGRLDILVNNAGISDLESFDLQDLERIEDIFQTNIMGTVYTTHAALPHMRAQAAGHILNVASIAGLFGFPWMAAYSSTKFAMVGLTEALRRELYGTGIRLTAFCPGTVDTPMAAEPLKDENLRKRISPKTAEETAQRIVEAVVDDSPEVVFGEVSGFLLRLMKFFPRLTDWAAHRLIAKLHPEVRHRMGTG